MNRIEVPWQFDYGQIVYERLTGDKMIVLARVLHEEMSDNDQCLLYWCRNDLRPDHVILRREVELSKTPTVM